MVSWHADATDAAVVELRASDAPGLLYRVTRALERAGADVRSARVSTLGGDVVDAFYLAGAWPDDQLRAQVGRRGRSPRAPVVTRGAERRPAVERRPMRVGAASAGYPRQGASVHVP